MIATLRIRVEVEFSSLIGHPVRVLRMEIRNTSHGITDNLQLAQHIEAVDMPGNDEFVSRHFWTAMHERYSAFIGQKEVARLVQKAVKDGVAVMGFSFAVRLEGEE